MANGVAPVRYVHSDSPGFSGELIEFLEAHANRQDLGDSFVAALVGCKTGTAPNTESFPVDAKMTVSVLEQFLAKALNFIAAGAPFFKTYEGTTLYKEPHSNVTTTNESGEQSRESLTRSICASLGPILSTYCAQRERNAGSYRQRMKRYVVTSTYQRAPTYGRNFGRSKK